MRTLFSALISFMLIGGNSTLTAGVVLQPTPAPDWEVATWLNADPGSLRDQRARVVLIGFFQLSCAASKEFSIPLFRRWNELYGDREDLVVVLVHSVFEAGHRQSPERLRQFLREHEISHPVGIDAHDTADRDVPVTMRRYRIDGTPQLVIVDKHGMLRFTHFGVFDPVPVEGFIERLLDEPYGSVETRPESMSRPERLRPTLHRRLSGTYLLRTEPPTGVCATWIPRFVVSADLRVYRDAIDFEFMPALLGTNSLQASYDARTGRVLGESILADPQRGDDSAGTLRFDGELEDQELRFVVSLMDGECRIQGRGHREP